jgi:hypothetical protein
MSFRPTRLASTLALVSLLVLPNVTLAAAPPVRVVTWQQHLAHMRAMGPHVGAHVTGCIAMHDSMAGWLGPDGMMVDMAGMMGQEVLP